MTTRAVLGVDIGTSSSKGVLVDLADGRILATASCEHSVDRPHPGWAEMDAAIWWREFVRLARELLLTPDVEVLAVGVSGMGPCVLLTDDDGHPLRPAILYGIDTRATAQIGRLTDELGGAEVIRSRCGSALSTQAVGPKLAWLEENEPGVYACARRLFMPSSWLVWHLTGEYLLDYHSASQSTPLYDSVEQDWYADWVRRIAPNLIFPRLLWADDVAGNVTAAAAVETGLPAGIPVIAGTIDAWAEAVSVGAYRPGDLMLMYGTTMFLINTVVEPITSPTLWGTEGVFRGTRSLAGGMATSGAVTAWLRDLFGSTDYPELLALARASGPGAHGLLMLPYFAGERTPIADPDARGLIAGLAVWHTRGDLYRAALEATALGVRHNLETMRDAGATIARIVAVGGGAQGTLWTQIVSDVTGLPQVIPTHTIGASFGVAFLAANAVASVSVDGWNPPKEIRYPTLDVARDYEELYGLYRDLYPATVQVSHALAARQLREPLAGQHAEAEPADLGDEQSTIKESTSNADVRPHGRKTK